MNVVPGTAISPAASNSLLPGGKSVAVMFIAPASRSSTPCTAKQRVWRMFRRVSFSRSGRAPIETISTAG
ncbi:hypothetical protein AAF143_10565 [Cyanobium sp. ATX-6F1]